MITEFAAQKDKKSSVVSQTAISAVIAFVTAGTMMGTVKSPLNIAFAVSGNPVTATAVLFGSLISYAATNSFYKTLGVLSALLAVVIFKWFCYRMTPSQNAVIAGLSYMAAGIIEIFLYKSSLTAIFICIFNSVILSGAAFVLSKMLSGEKSIAALLREERMYALFICMTAAAVLSSVTLFIINPGRIAAVVVILYAVRKYGSRVGAETAVCMTFAAAVGSFSLGADMIFFGICAFIAGYVSFAKKTASALAFLLMVICSGFLLGISAQTIRMFIDTAFGSIIFSLIPCERAVTEAVVPEPVSAKAKTEYVYRVMETPCVTEGVVKFAQFRMKILSASIDEARKTSCQVSRILESKPDTMEPVRAVHDTVCSRCSNKGYCWSSRHDITQKAFVKASRMENISVSNLPEEFNYCFRRSDIAFEFKNNIYKRMINLTVYEYVKRIQEVLENQLRVSSDIINSVTAKTSKKIEFDNGVTAKIEQCLRKNDIQFTACVAYYNQSRRLFAEIFCQKDTKISGYQIYKALSDELSRVFECTKYYNDTDVRFLVRERPQYNIECYISQCSAAEGEPNGDTCDCFRDDYGNVYAVISDGMGTGKNAEIDSRVTVTLFKNLVCGGVDVAQAVNIINSVMLSKSKDETFATIDAAKFDLDTGRMTMYKSGAGPSLLRHNNSVFKINATTYPVGIMGSSQPYSKCFPLMTDDVVAMFSDGVTEENMEYIRNEITLDYVDVSETSNRICKNSQKIEGHDDISVIVAKIIKQ
ncbi:MAG: SpoIIE family protein phosphatase [Oscillospiraceae bacterium]|nr:SpoIIE family protein phosphatase [Oscillospiraceae bacterium]